MAKGKTREQIAAAVQALKDKINIRNSKRAIARSNRNPLVPQGNPMLNNARYRQRQLATSAGLARGRMTGSGGHGSQFQNTRAIRANTGRLGEEIILDYLLNEGFASDKNSALSIMNAMSEEWVSDIIDELS